MKKKLIKKGEIIFGDYFDKHILHDSIILHKTNLNCLIRSII